MTLRALALVFLGSLIWAGGCGSDGGGGGSAGSAGTGGGSCDAACARITGAGCPNEDSLSTCVADCQAYRNQCAAQLDPFLSCLNQGTVQCNASGEAQVLGCDAQVHASNQCTACLIAPSTNACASCGKSKCCAEVKAFFAPLESIAFGRCIDACTNDTCVQACENQFPNMKTPYQTFLGCLISKCQAEC